MKNQNFDKYFKNNADERSYDFDESFWNEMETLIDQQDESTPATNFNWRKLWIAGLLFLLVGSTIAFFKLPTFNSSHKGNIENNVSSSPNFQDKTTNPVEATPNSIILNKKENNNNTVIKGINSTQKESVVIASTIKNSNEIDNSSISKRPKTQNPSKSKQSNDPIINNETSSSVTKNNKTKITKTKNTAQSQNVKSTSDKSGKEKASKPVAVSTDSEVSNQSGDNSLGTKVDHEVPLLNNISILDANVIEEWVYLISDINPLFVESIKLGAFPTFEPNKETSNKAIKPQRTFQIGVVAGSHFYQGYKNMGEKRIPLSNDYFGGLYIKTAFNNKWSGKIGLNYWQRDALNSVINVDSTVYGFGSTVYSKTVNLHGIQAIELPISVALDFGKSALTAGIQVNYILNSKGTYQETVSDAFSTINRGEITQNGYQTLFNRLDFGLSIGYEYKMTDLINLGAQAQMGFVDVTKNAIFKNTTTDRNLMLKVYATYDFWIFGNKNKSLPFQINR